MPPVPSWFWFFVGVLVILGILWLVGIRFDVNMS
jgi:hypothetical protein